MKKILSIFLSICTLCLLMPTVVFAQVPSGLHYSESGDTVKITEYVGDATEVEIPDTIDGKTVTEIGEYAFLSTNVESVKIPDGVTSIGMYAFRNCGALKNINIPESVTSIGQGAFFSCWNLENIKLPSGITSISPETFVSCSKLTNITIPENVVSIGNAAFYQCMSLSSIEIPKNVTSIGNNAFYQCISLSSIEIPKNVTSIGISALAECDKLADITVDEGNLYYCCEDGILFNIDKTELIQYPINKSCESYNIPESVTSIRTTAFSLCKNLTSISIPASVASIGDNAFLSCSNLKNVSFGMNSQLESINRRTFESCGSLESIVIPESVNSIQDMAFYGCSNLKSIFLPDKELSIGTEHAILDTTSKIRYKIENGKVIITSIDLGSGKTDVEIPAKIGGYPVTGVADGLLDKISSHTHYYNWTEINGKYKGECGICKEKTQEQTVPTIVINAPEKVCRTQDTVVSVSLPEGLKNAALYHEFSHSGGEIDLDASDGLNGKVSHESYPGEENGLKFVVYAKTSDGFEFTVTKTVEILDNHILEHISAKDATASKEGNIEYWTCKVCEKYFSDKDGENEIELKDIVVSRKAPEIIEGKGQSVNQGEKKSLSFTSNAPFNEFKYVKLDGKVLDSKNYTVKEGSTIVTLNKDFVSTLKAGKHILTIVSETGEASVEFIVNKTSTAKPSKNTTNTGLVSNIGLWISLMFTSLDAMCIGLICRKRKMK